MTDSEHNGTGGEGATVPGPSRFVAPKAFRDHFSNMIGKTLVFGYGTNPKADSSLLVFVSDRAELSDTVLFPLSFEGMKVEYVQLPYPPRSFGG